MVNILSFEIILFKYQLETAEPLDKPFFIEYGLVTSKGITLPVLPVFPKKYCVPSGVVILKP